MDRVECETKMMSYTSPRTCKVNAPWPRYLLVCGEVKRLLSPDAVIERLEGMRWVEEKQLH